MKNLEVEFKVYDSYDKMLAVYGSGKDAIKHVDKIGDGSYYEKEWCDYDY